MREINQMPPYEYDDQEIRYTPKRRKIKHPGRLIVVILTLLICIWMVYNFIISIATGQKFSILGNTLDPIQNVVVAGVDEGGYRTDLILFCQVNRRDGEVNILQIPRDTKVQNNRNDKKINSAYYSGFDVMSEEIEQVTGLVAEDYIMIDFEGFNDVIDAMGGVTVNVPIRMYYTDPVQDLTIDLQPGEQRLNGKRAQMFMRFRQNNDGTGYTNGDVDRLKAQRSLYEAVAKKMISPAGIIRAPFVFGSIKSNCETNMSAGEIISFLRNVAAVGKRNIYMHSLPGGGKYIGGGSYFVHDKAATQALVKENFVIE